LWRCYMAEEYENPSRNDYYLMQINALIESWMAGKFVSPDSKKIKFTSKSDQEENELPQSDGEPTCWEDVKDSSQEEQQKLIKKLSDNRRDLLLAYAMKQRKGSD